MRFSLVLLVIVLSSYVPLFSQSTSEIKVVSFNLWRRNDSWPQRLDNAIKLIEGEGADLVGLQEGDENTQYDVEGRLAGYSLETGPWNEQASSILFNTNTITILESGTFGYSSEPDNPAVRDWGDGAIHGWLRTCLWVLAEHKPSGTRFYAYNTHLDANGFSSNPPYWRALETKLLAQRVADRSHPEYPYIVLGDLNGVENEEAITYLKSNANGNPSVMVDTYRHILPNGPGDSFGSVKYDYIMVGAEEAEHIIDANIIYQHQYGFTSDHNQVFALIDFQNNSVTPPQDSLWVLADYDNIDLTFNGFGGSAFDEVDNPNTEVRNNSSRVGTTVQGAETWAGIYSTTLSRKIDFSITPHFMMKVWAEHSGELLVKFENSSNQNDYFEQVQPLTGLPSWQDIQIDFSMASSGRFDKLVLFFDFGNGAEDRYYFDDLILAHPSKVADCHGEEGGSATYDHCDVCSGGNTGVEPNQCIVTSTGEYRDYQGLTVHPNPSDGIFHLNQLVHYEVVDIHGKVQQRGHSEIINISGLKSGIYILVAHGERLPLIIE